jgi:ribosome maturation factor RimP
MDCDSSESVIRLLRLQAITGSFGDKKLKRLLNKGRFFFCDSKKTEKKMKQTDTTTPNLLLWTESERKIYSLLSPLLKGLGYRLIAIDAFLVREAKLVLYIDFDVPSDTPGKTAIGIEDCIKVTKAINPFLDTNSEFETIFNGPYELEVSSPGAERPLKQLEDFKAFEGRRARIQLARPLTAQEIKNEAYLSSNPTQKNFLGNLRGLEADQLKIGIPKLSGDALKPKKPGQKISQKKLNESLQEESVWIPLGLITKAHLEPEFNLKGRK